MANKLDKYSGDSDTTLKRVLEILPALLPQATILETRIGVKAGPVRADIQIKVRIGNVTKLLLCEVKTKGEPKYLLNAIGQLTLAAKKFPNAYPVVIVPALSREGISVMRNAEMGYITLAGEIHLRFGTVFIERTAAQPNPALLKDAKTFQRQRRLPFPFSARASRIIRALIEKPGQFCTLRDFAKETDITLRLAELAIDKLDEKGYIKKEHGATQLLKPKELLNAWAEVYKFQEANMLYYYYSFARNFDEFASKLIGLPKEFRDSYRFTMYAGASLVGPRVRFTDVHLYIKKNPKEWAKRLDLNPVESGANVILAIPFDAGVFDYAQEKKGLMAVSNTQLFLDLYNLNDRAREQAEILYKEFMSRPDPGSLGERIKKARLERMGTRGTMTRQGLADFIGVSDDLIAAWENNESVPDNRQIERLAKWLRKPLEYFTQTHKPL